jgi:fused signal recognition particle receptor
MLGWFKKKFGKQPVAPEPAEPELSGQGTEAAVSVVPVETPAPELVVEPAIVESGEAVADDGEPVADEPVVALLVEKVPEELTVEESPAQEADAVEEEPAASELLPPAEIEEVAGAEPEAAVVPELEEDVAEESAPEEIEASEPEAVLEPASSEVVVPDELPEAKPQDKPAGKSLFQRLQERLGKTRDAFVYRLDRLFLGKKEIDQDLFEQLEEILISADLGVATTMELLDEARKKVKRDQLSDPQALKAIIRDQILAYIEDSEQPAELVLPQDGPFVIMVVGVNGVGKTTTIGKLAAKFVRSGQSVLLVAGDTFRAAAINQLRIWGERVGVEVIAQNPGADPSSVVFDGLEYGVAHHHDVIIVDTAGRLHTSVNLMAELKKINRVIGKKMPGAPHEVMLVLDATTGQNSISQAKLFHEAVGVTGLTLTKLDGTAKGGIVANVCREIKIPVRFIGIGEQIDDLRDFDAREFVDALFAGQAEGT